MTVAHDVWRNADSDTVLQTNTWSHQNETRNIEPLRSEVERAITHLKGGKSSGTGIDNINTMSIKANGDQAFTSTTHYTRKYGRPESGPRIEKEPNLM